MFFHAKLRRFRADFPIIPVGAAICRPPKRISVFPLYTALCAVTIAALPRPPPFERRGTAAKRWWKILGIRESDRHAQKALFSQSSGIFLLAIRKYWRARETPDYAKTKAFWVLAVLKCHIFVGTRKKTKQCCRLARLFDAVTAKKGHFKTESVRLSYALTAQAVLKSVPKAPE